MNLARAQSLAVKIMGELLPFCEKIAIAGSVRRERNTVNDVDLVLIPKNGLVPIVTRMTRNCDTVTGGKTSASRNLKYRMKCGFEIDLFIAHGEIVDLVSRTPTNWGAVLLCRTGSMQHNAQLCSYAHTKGLKFAPYRGVVTAGSKDCEGHNPGDIIASETEEEIYTALGLKWRDPREREVLK